MAINNQTFCNENLISLENKKIAILVSEWNSKITNALKEEAVTTLLIHKANKENIVIVSVPGSFELPLTAQWFANQEDIDTVLCFGCIIKGDTPHFEYISHAVALGISNVALSSNKPILFGVLTTNNLEQAEIRSGLKLFFNKSHNKGKEIALSAIKMLAIKESL